MDTKNYLLLARTLTGAINESVTINTDLDNARQILKLVMNASSTTLRGEIIEGNRDYIGDFRVKPLLRVLRTKDGSFTEEAG